MKEKIGLTFCFIGAVVMFTSLTLAAYKTDPLAAVAIGGGALLLYLGF